MKAEPNSFQIDPEGPSPIPPGFRVFIGGSRSGQIEPVFMSQEALDWKAPEEYVYANTFSQTMSTSRASYRLKYRVYATAGWMKDVNQATVDIIVGNEAVDWVVSAEDWMESQGM